jgi:hypothetical protein
MPMGDGTGPTGRGAGMGRGVGAGRGAGRGRGGGPGLGSGGNCVCPSCGRIAPHQRGVQCFNVKCPDCQTPMTRAR